MRSEARRALAGQVGRKKRPVLVLTRSEVIDVRDLITVAEVTTSIRGLALEVDVGHAEVELDRLLVINCDGIHTVVQATLSGPIGEVGDLRAAFWRATAHQAVAGG